MTMLAACHKTKQLTSSQLVTWPKLLVDLFRPHCHHQVHTCQRARDSRSEQLAYPSVDIHSNHPVGGRCDPQTAYLNSMQGSAFSAHNLGKLAEMILSGSTDFVYITCRPVSSNGTLRVSLVYSNVT
jgi:hypothetical protein